MAELLQVVGFGAMVFGGYGTVTVTAAAPIVLRPAAGVWLVALLLAFAWYWPNLTT